MINFYLFTISTVREHRDYPTKKLHTNVKTPNVGAYRAPCQDLQSQQYFILQA